jgi:hypothetical protein
MIRKESLELSMKVLKRDMAMEKKGKVGVLE